MAAFQRSKAAIMSRLWFRRNRAEDSSPLQSAKVGAKLSTM